LPPHSALRSQPWSYTIIQKVKGNIWCLKKVNKFTLQSICKLNEQRLWKLKWVYEWNINGKICYGLERGNNTTRGVAYRLPLYMALVKVLAWLTGLWEFLTDKQAAFDHIYLSRQPLFMCSESEYMKLCSYICVSFGGFTCTFESLQPLVHFGVHFYWYMFNLADYLASRKPYLIGYSISVSAIKEHVHDKGVFGNPLLMFDLSKSAFRKRAVV